MSDSHVFDPTILRQYDIRGIVGESLDPADLKAVGRAFGTIGRRRGVETVAVGYDGRLSSPELEAALVEGLVSTGAEVLRVGMGPSPMLYYATHVLDAQAGVMITGSHNPPDYNGIKMVMNGASFFADDIQELGRVAAAGDWERGEGSARDVELMERYVERLASDYRGERALEVVWDSGNGVAGEAMEKLTARLPGTHVLLNAEIDGTFPNHHPDPTEERNLEQLKEAVAAEGADLGIAFDGDGDRIGVIDGRGRVLWGDQLMTLYAREVLADEPGATIISEVKASQALYDEIARLGGKPLMAPTGHSIIKTLMKETGSPLAGEMSGHIFFKHRYYGYDDALYAAVRTLSIVAASDKSLAEMRDAMPEMINTPELRFDCAEERKFGVIQEVKARLAEMDGVEVDDTDGVRVKTADGWWLLRASNTQAVLVARCEASTDEGLGRLKAILAEQLRASGLEPPAAFG